MPSDYTRALFRAGIKHPEHHGAPRGDARRSSCAVHNRVMLASTGPLEGRIALVTGAGRGIGRATAIALAAAGAEIAIAARSQSELDETAHSIRSDGGICIAVPADVLVEEQCERLVDTVAAHFGRLDILVNNAGGARFAPWWELTTEDFDYNLAINLRSAFLVSRAAVRYMLPHKSGVIVHVASSSGKKPYAGQGAYCAAKAGQIALARVMALELRDHGIRVHTICPGGVDTRLAAEMHPHRDRTNWIQPEDVAETILHLVTLPAHVTVDEVVLRRYDADPLW